ncbi:MAG: hypothetical protein AB7S38_21040 [Vulcanimicrobiota bacterium]
MKRSLVWLVVVTVATACLVRCLRAPSLPEPTPSIVGCTAEDIYGPDTVMAGCWHQLANLAATAQAYRKERGRWPDDLGPRLACQADAGQPPALRVEQDHIVIFCPGAAHAKVGLPPDYPRYDSRWGMLLHPPVDRIDEGGLNMTDLRPGMSFEQASRIAGPGLRLNRLNHIYSHPLPLSTVILDSQRKLAFLESSALSSKAQLALCVGDPQSEAHRLLGQPLRSGPTGQFPPQGDLFRVDGLDVHIDFRNEHVDRIYLTVPDYKPEWSLWRE